MLVGQALHVLWPQTLDDLAQEGVLGLVARAVQLKDVEQEQGLFEMRRCQTVVDGEQRVRQHVHDALCAQVGREVEDVFAQALELRVLGLSDVVGQDVQFAAVLGEVGGDFLADEGAGQVRDLKGAVDGVVVGDGDHAHAARAGDVVDAPGFGEAFRAAHALEQPLRGPRGMLGVHVQVDAKEVLVHRASR